MGGEALSFARVQRIRAVNGRHVVTVGRDSEGSRGAGVAVGTGHRRGRDGTRCGRLALTQVHADMWRKLADGPGQCRCGPHYASGPARLNPF
jgi:hypothetical protein